MDIRDIANMNMDIGILRGIAMKEDDSCTFDMITGALDDLEEIAGRMLDEVEGRMQKEPEEEMILDLKRMVDDGE